MPLTKDERKKLDETHDTVIELKTVLLGADGNPGLIHQVNSNTKRSHRNTVILAALIGSGILGGGTIGIIQLLIN